MSFPAHSSSSLLRLVFFLFVVGAAVAACGETVTQVGEGDVVELRLSLDSAEVGVGRTLDLDALPLDADESLLVNQDVSWSTSAVDVATVDDDGVVTGVSVGEAEITATLASHTATAVVTVLAPPEIILSANTVEFTAQAGGSDPGPDSVMVTNGGELDLTGLAIDSVTYGEGAEDWLLSALSSAVAPSTLSAEARIAGITAAGTYEATIWVSAVEAEGSPATVNVLLTIEAGAAASVSVQAGDGQTATVGTAVATPPAVRISDAFGNPVAGAEVTFAVTGGGGSVTGSPATTDASGVATVGSWVLGTTAGANSLSASVDGVAPVAFGATGVAGAAAQLAVSAGDGQSAVAGTEVAVPPAVAALDEFGNGVADVSVTFDVVAGGGSVAGASGTTDADGIFAVDSWTLGTSAGENRLRAVAESIPDSVELVATALSGEADALILEAGDAQTDTVAATLPVAYAVRVVDSFGNGVSGVSVSWSVTGGGGSIDGTSTTDADGIATATRVLGTTVGTMTAEAAVGGLTGSPVAFTATAVAGTAAIMSQVAGDGQTATVDTEVAVAPEVLVTDRFSNPVAGEAVTFSVTAGGGAVSPTTAILTDADGTAALTSWTLGTVSGTDNNAVEATAATAGLTGDPATFTASATADAPAAIVVSSTNPQTQITGQNVPSPPTATVEDQFGNPVPDVTVDFSPSGGGSVGSASVITSASGTASTTWTVTTSGHTVQTDGTFPNTLTATVNGTAISTAFSADAIYSYAEHVNPNLCVGCHTGTTPPAGLSLDGNAAADYDELVLEPLACDDDGTQLPADYRRVSTAGGVQAADDFSMLLRYTDPGLSGIGACDFAGSHSTLSAEVLTIIRAWIRNGAPEN